MPPTSIAAFADPAIRGILAVVGGEDQITVIPHLDAELARRDPKPFLGTSDNTNLHHWLWANGVASFYGGSSQVRLGPGPGVDDDYGRSLRSAFVTNETLEITDPGESEDVGVDWGDPRVVNSFGEREPTEPWSWHGPPRSVTGRTWGGCLEVIEWVFTAGRFPFDPDVLDGGVLIIETSEELLPARNVGWIVCSLGERGILAAVDAVLVARRRCPTSPAVRLLRNGPGCVLRSGTSSSSLLAGTTLKPSCASAFRLGTRVRSGSSRTVAQSLSTAPRAGWSPTTHDRQTCTRAAGPSATLHRSVTAGSVTTPANARSPA